MRRILMSVTAVIVSLAVAGAAQAGKGKSSPNYIKSSYPTTTSTYKVVSSYPTSVKYVGPYTNYVKLYGIQFASGVYFKKTNCKFWSTKCYLAKYGCTCFWCPCYDCYYYFCVPDDCYYPVTFCPYKRYCW